MSRKDLDWNQIRNRLEGHSGRVYWRSLEELADTEEFRELLEREFPENASEWTDGVSRRNFLQLMGASLALAGVSACTPQPVEKIVPYVRQPEEIVPGKPLFFATAMTLGGIATGILAESHMGRPTKIEGNPDHPASLGATDIFAQASVLSLYDPDRSQAINNAGNISSWTTFYQTLRIRMALEKQRSTPGSGLRLLTETITSPTLARQIQELLADLPYAKWHQYEPVNRDSAREGAKMAFGQYVDTLYRFERADVVVALDSDFLTCGPASLRNVHDFIGRRRVRKGSKRMNRLYSFESIPTNTGAVADHRWAIRSDGIAAIGRQIAEALEGKRSPSLPGVAEVVEDLQQYRGTSIVLAGEHQTPEVHAVVHTINQTLGNAGNTVLYIDSVDANPVNQMGSLRELTGDMRKGTVETLVILGGNPVFTAPVDLKFAEALSKVNLRIHLSLYNDETSFLCHWHLPETHYLEMWSDARAFDGTASIIQPLITPFYGGKSAHELVSAMMGRPERSGYEIVRDYWKQQNVSADFEAFWRRSVHDGFVANTAFTPKSMAIQAYELSEKKPPQGTEIQFRPDPSIYDGRFANNGWLQELPKPLTKLTWDNAALISPAMARRMDLQNEDVVELEIHGSKLHLPVWIVPGQADDSVTVHFGYGRERAGKLGNGSGFNAYRLRTSTAPWFASGLSIRKTGERYLLACTQSHWSMEGRHLVRTASLHKYQEHPDFAREMEEEPSRDQTLYKNYEYKGYSWGMAIDLNACVGCNACIVACQSENNIPLVGKDQVRRGREMQWLRIDRYYEGNPENPEIHHQPVLCMHCENAPCEVVCPVNATLHDSEGLNVMVYNRCIGTRYCSNNCPYKVRRFNFYLYSDMKTPSLKLQRNPDVTVRTRGVMEKCTYCVQRINEARIEAEKQDRAIRDGEIITACQQVCPAQAIVFGNINDPGSRVAKLKAESLNYGILTELNTRPRTTYLARVRNPNPEIKGTKL